MSTRYLGKNKESVNVYCTVLRVAGWALLASGVLSCVRHIIGIASIPAPTSHDLARYILLPQFVKYSVFPGILSLGVAQLIRYIFDREYQARWILRNTDKILYAYAIFILAAWVLRYLYGRTGSGLPPWWELPLLILMLIPSLIILIGLGRLLRLVMPIIEESRTLV